ncbi:MAG: methylmalonyl Co-A mutase-associated GTPase MeaB [Longimicrobiales bacterium]
MTQPTAELSTLLEAFGRKQKTALARAISMVENRRAGFEAFLHALHSRLGHAHRIGITGPPGAGKSTLSAALTHQYRQKGERVGVVAVDPTSPYTGGALLGDRIRMNELALDDGVFIRSMASRGSLGGLAITTKEVADVMDAYGFDRVLLETVGVGQSELDVAAASDSTVVILVPESGDSIQAMKAGLMEAADLFVINKSDRPGADRIAREIQMMLHLRHGQALRNVPAHHGVHHKRVRATGAPTSAPVVATTWEIPVLQTVAENGTGVPQLEDALDRHRKWLQDSGELARRRRQRLEDRVREAVARRIQTNVWQESGGQELLDSALPALESGAETPYGVADRIVRAALG